MDEMSLATNHSWRLCSSWPGVALGIRTFTCNSKGRERAAAHVKSCCAGLEGLGCPSLEQPQQVDPNSHQHRCRWSCAAAGGGCVVGSALPAFLETGAGTWQLASGLPAKWTRSWHKAICGKPPIDAFLAISSRSSGIQLKEMAS